MDVLFQDPKVRTAGAAKRRKASLACNSPSNVSRIQVAKEHVEVAMNRWLAKSASAVVCVLMVLGSGSPLFARTRTSCREHLRHAENNLRAAVRKHGEHSSQAEKRRREVEKVRAECRM
jgi:hypothetical protein